MRQITPKEEAAIRRVVLMAERMVGGQQRAGLWFGPDPDVLIATHVVKSDLEALRPSFGRLIRIGGAGWRDGEYVRVSGCAVRGRHLTPNHYIDAAVEAERCAVAHETDSMNAKEGN